VRACKLLLILLLLSSSTVFAEKKIKIAVIPKSTHPWWLKMKAGAQKAAQEQNAQIFWISPETEDQVEKQIEFMNGLIDKTDGIVLAPLDTEKLVASVEKAMAQKKPVAIVDAMINTSKTTSFLATDNKKAGAVAAAEMAKALTTKIQPKTKPKVAIYRFIKGIQTTDDRALGFEEAAAKLQQFEIIREDFYAGTTEVTSINEATRLLKKYPDLKGIFAVNWPSFENLYRAVKKTGSAGKIKLVGIDEPEACLDGIRKGEVSAVIMQDPFNMGYLGVKAVVNALKNKPVEKHIDTGTVVITAENIDSPEIKKALKPKSE